MGCLFSSEQLQQMADNRQRKYVEELDWLYEKIHKQTGENKELTDRLIEAATKWELEKGFDKLFVTKLYVYRQIYYSYKPALVNRLLIIN